MTSTESKKKYLVPRRLNAISRSLHEYTKNWEQNGVVPTASELENFERFVNDAQPQNDEERTVKNTIDSLVFHEPSFAHKIANNPKLRPLVLWLRPNKIVNQFRVVKRVHLKYNTETGLYKAEKYEDRHATKSEHKKATSKAKELAQVPKKETAEEDEEDDEEEEDNSKEEESEPLQISEILGKSKKK